MADHPTDNETPRETLERMGEHKVRALLPMCGIPQYLEPHAIEWIAELDAGRAEKKDLPAEA